MYGFDHIRQLDYTVIFARDLAAMRSFYEGVLRFNVGRTLGEDWIEYHLGATTLALTRYGARFHDPAPPAGALSLQLAFRVPPGAVVECAQALANANVPLAAPVTDHAWGHRTLFVRDPDGNVIEIYAEI